jgi:pseudouridylate synthase I
MNRIAVKIAYLGSEFLGSQIQPGAKTVAGSILENLEKIQDIFPDLKLAGRTDKGVNALGNVAVFNTSVDPVKMIKALNAVSSGIFYRSFAIVDENFNPRHANERIYRYTLDTDGLDIGMMKECSKLFEGEHDFKRFCKNDERSTVVNMRSITIDRNVIEFRADHFLWNMIRRIVSAMVSVASGKSSLSDVKDALNGKNITFGVARGDALTLADVIYEGMEFTDVPEGGKRIREEMFRLSLTASFYNELNK